MFMHQTSSVPGPLDEEFSRPVESIMRCEDFKSNFARRLSNRYISRTPATTKRQGSLKIRKSDCEIAENAPERIGLCSQLSKIRLTEQNGEVVKPPDKPVKNHNIRDTEVSALNMEIEKLRWQLDQTEANRQMHIALLKQIVTFLSRVKDHIEYHPESGTIKDIESTREISSVSFNIADLARSPSVLHVNKTADFSLSTNKKLGTRKISKSINNGNKDCNGVWTQSKNSLTPDMENAFKITEEISRLITLANTVLSTKLPDLACKCNDSNDILKEGSICTEQILENMKSNSTLNLIEGDNTNAFILNTIYESEDAFYGVENKVKHDKEKAFKDFVVSSLPLSCGLENGYTAVHVNNKDVLIQNQTECNPKIISGDKRDEYNHVTNFMEDESGFSSMSSFQEIGIPIISIIPPSPCKEVGYIEELTDILDEADKWKSEILDLDKQTVKVFWV